MIARRRLLQGCVATMSSTERAPPQQLYGSIRRTLRSAAARVTTRCPSTPPPAPARPSIHFKRPYHTRANVPYHTPLFVCTSFTPSPRKWPMSVHEMTAAMYYLLAQRRGERGADPNGEHTAHAGYPVVSDEELAFLRRYVNVNNVLIIIAFLHRVMNGVIRLIRVTRLIPVTTKPFRFGVNPDDGLYYLALYVFSSRFSRRCFLVVGVGRKSDVALVGKYVVRWHRPRCLESRRISRQSLPVVKACAGNRTDARSARPGKIFRHQLVWRSSGAQPPLCHLFAYCFRRWVSVAPFWFACFCGRMSALPLHFAYTKTALELQVRVSKVEGYPPWYLCTGGMKNVTRLVIFARSAVVLCAAR